MKTIILAAGKIDYTHLPFGMHQSNATIPVNGRPVISWIIQDLLQKGYEDIIIVIRPENIKLSQLLNNHFAKKANINIETVEAPTSILESLSAGLSVIPSGANSLQVVLGDTLIYDDFDQATDYVLVGPVTSSEKWCTATTDASGCLQELTDKQYLPGNQHLALCGYYCFSDLNLLRASLDNCLQNGKEELSAVLLAYHQQKPLKVIEAKEWFDFGHLDTLIESKKSLIRPRHFNHIQINPVLNTLTKTSKKSEKLEDELNWYKLLPPELQILTPRILSEAKHNGQIDITQEYYGYPALSELFLYGDLSVDIWRSIIRYLFEVHHLFRSYQKEDKPHWREAIYRKKSEQRLQALRAQNKLWDTLLSMDYVQINGQCIENIPSLWKKVQPKINSLIEQGEISIIHGDYCLSNILYDLNNQIVRLIDPRGSFGEKGIYGDPRYDIAKLRHSFVGLYDYIISDLFQISYDSGVFNYIMPESPFIQQIQEIFDDQLSRNQYCLEDIKLIEGLLFLSMIPYHQDYLERQLMMYVRTLEILNHTTIQLLK